MEAEKEGLAHPEAFEGEAATTGAKVGGKPSSNGYVLVDNADKQQEVESEEELGQVGRVCMYHSSTIRLELRDPQQTCSKLVGCMIPRGLLGCAGMISRAVLFFHM
jgi:hypothetical protein